MQKVVELPPIADRRPTLRRKSLLPGVIVWDQGRHYVTCTIRDLSNKGARIVMPPRILPREVYFINITHQYAQHAQVRWSKSSQVGLHFVKHFDLSANDKVAPAFLKSILAAHTGL